MSIIDRIDAAAEATGVDLNAASDYYAESLAKQPAYRKLKTTREEVNLAISALVKTPADQISDAWATVVETYTRHLAWEGVEDLMFHRIQATINAAEKNAPWKALALLTGHIEKVGKEIVKLSQHDIDSAQRAIAAGRVKEYERFDTLATELEQLTTLPDLPQRGDKDPALIIISPPEIPQYRNPDMPNPEDHGKGPHTEDETELHQQATDYQRGSTFRDRLLTAARNGWEITPATNLDEHKDRLRQVINGTTWKDAAFRHTRNS